MCAWYEDLELLRTMTGRTVEDYELDDNGQPRSVGEAPAISFPPKVPHDVSARKKNALLLALYIARASSAFFMTTVAGVSCFLASQYWLEFEGRTYRMTNVDIPLAILAASLLYRGSMVFKSRFGVEVCSFAVSILAACAYVPFYVSLFTFPFHPAVYWLVRTALWTCFFQHLFSFVQILEHRGLVRRRFDAALLVPVLWWPAVFGCLVAALIYYATRNSDARADLLDHEIQRLKNMTTCVFGLLMAYWTALSVAQLLQQKAEKLCLLGRLGGRAALGPGKLILQDAVGEGESAETHSSVDDRGLRHLMVSDRDSTAIPVEPGDDLSGALHSVPKDTGALPDLFGEDPCPTLRSVARDHWILTRRTLMNGQHRTTLAVCLLLMSSIFQASRRSVPDMRDFFFQVPVLIFVVLTLVGSALAACTLRLPLAPERRRTLAHAAWTASAAFVVIAMCLEMLLDWESFDSTEPSPGAVASRDVFLGVVGFVLGVCFGFVVIECCDTDDTRDREDDASSAAEVVALCEIPFSLCVVAFALGVFLQETVIRLACLQDSSWVPGSDSGEVQGEGECYYAYLPWCAAVACFLCAFFVWIPRVARCCVRR